MDIIWVIYAPVENAASLQTDQFAEFRWQNIHFFNFADHANAIIPIG